MDLDDQQDAATWLQGPEARDLAAALDLDKALGNWLARGMPDLAPKGQVHHAARGRRLTHYDRRRRTPQR